MIGQSSATTWAIRRDSMILDQKTFIKNPLQTPPHTVDVFLIHGPVGLIHVYPVAHAGSHVFKFIYVTKY